MPLFGTRHVRDILGQAALPRGRRAVWVLALAGLALGQTGVASAAPAGSSARAKPAIVNGPPAVRAYAWANNRSAASYRPDARFSYNSTGQGIKITRSNVGKYKVTFFGLGAFASQGTVDVSVEGLNNIGLCSVTNWGPDSTGANLKVGVDCFTLSGASMDNLYMIAFTSGGSTTGTLDYVWANQPTAASYTPATAYQFNSSGGTNTISRLGVGSYEVFLPGPVVANGSVKVTYFGTQPDACQVVEWLDNSPGQNVYVDCFNSAGVLTDARFTMTFVASDNLLGDGAPGGYIWADQPTAPSYTPNTLYQYDSVGTTATVQMLSTGEWEVLFPGDAQGPHGDQQATAYGSTDTHCEVDGPVGRTDGQEQGDVFCYDNSGNPINAYYTTQWMVN